MTNYNLILDEYFTRRTRFLKPLLYRWMIAAWNRIHPEEEISGPEHVMIPAWGLPSVRTLVVQAADDSRLGMEHYNLLMEQLDIEHESHVLDDLRHSGDSEHRGRTEITQKFLEETLF